MREKREGRKGRGKDREGRGKGGKRKKKVTQVNASPSPKFLPSPAEREKGGEKETVERSTIGSGGAQQTGRGKRGEKKSGASKELAIILNFYSPLP